MKTISVLSRKGGAGKTTVSVNLGLAAMQAGMKVVLADLDPLRSASEVLGGRPEAASLLVEAGAAKLPLLQDACAGSGCDLLIVDTPTAPESDVKAAIQAADLCLAVARPTRLDVAAVKQTLELLRGHRARALVVLNQCPPARGDDEADLVETAVAALREGGVPLAGTRLRSRAAYQHAFAEGQSVGEWEPDGEAAGDVVRLLAQVREQLDAPEISAERIAKLRRGLAAPKAAAAVELARELLRRFPLAARA